MDKAFLADVKEAQKFVYETMKRVRDGNLEVAKAACVNKGAREIVQLGKLEIEAEGLSKD